MEAPRTAHLLLALALGSCGSVPKPKTVEAARKLDLEAIETRSAEIDAAENGRRFVVVQGGRLSAVASLADDALRASRRDDPAPLHRFVFRPGERGPRLYRMAYVAQGGLVAGRAFLADLGLDAAVTPGRPAVIRQKSGSGTLDLSRTGTIPVEVATIDGAHREAIAVTFDPDFDGTLLVPPAVAQRLSLARYEIPGTADVQVALGRPFAAHRAGVVVTIQGLVSGRETEALFEARR